MTLSAARIATLAQKLGVSEELLARAYAESAEATRSEAIKQSWKKPGVRAKRTAGIKASWNDPERRERWMASLRVANDDPALRAKRSAIAKRRYENEAARAALAEQGRQAAADPVVAAKKSEKMTMLRADPARAVAWAANSAEAKRTPESRARQAAAMKASWDRRRQAKACATDAALIEEAIAAGRVIRCPTAAVGVTTATIPDAEKAALSAHADAAHDAWKSAWAKRRARHG